jgi:hypothetical protein
MAKRTCSVEGCERTAHARGWCQMHYWRWKTRGEVGSAEPERIRGDDERRWWSFVDKQGPIPEHRPDLGPCWLWTSYSDGLGYSMFGSGGRTVRAYSWGYKTFVGPVPPGKELDHLCRNHACVNYERHLDPVTHRENMLRGESLQAQNARKLVCIRGHEFTGVQGPDGRWRKCKQCARDWAAQNRDVRNARRRERRRLVNHER